MGEALRSIPPEAMQEKPKDHAEDEHEVTADEVTYDVPAESGVRLISDRKASEEKDAAAISEVKKSFKMPMPTENSRIGIPMPTDLERGRAPMPETAGMMPMPEAPTADQTLGDIAADAAMDEAQNKELATADKDYRNSEKRQLDLANMEQQLMEVSKTIPDVMASVAASERALKEMGIADPTAELARRASGGGAEKAGRFFKKLFSRDTRATENALAAYDAESQKLSDMQEQQQYLKMSIENPDKMADLMSRRGNGSSRLTSRS